MFVMVWLFPVPGGPWMTWSQSPRRAISMARS